MRTLPAGLLLLATLCVWGASPTAAADGADTVFEHAIAVTLEPEKHHIHVVDEIRFPEKVAVLARTMGTPIAFRLHAGLTVKSTDASEFTVRAVAGQDAGKTGHGEEGQGHRLRVKRWELLPKKGGKASTAILEMSGTIHHPLTMESEEYARSFSRTPGTISKSGVFLGGSSWWLPRFGEELVTFTLNVSLPEGWDAVSQGARAAGTTRDGRRTVVWVCPHPMDEVYLIANRFHEYTRSAGGVQAQAFLRSADETLANKYLEVTAQYIEMYRQLLGPYPFKKFALIENFWETGYGMPSFTLLGPRVIRFPFILHSSYPHEILHNWWGNSVYVDWKTGNWCEGLTAYLADHLVREGQGRGVEYRQDTLKSYRNYVKAGKDFPLTQFRSRHSSATQAVGYGKCLMFCHMLRRMVGDKSFVRGLQRFYRDNRWKRASFDDMRIAFEAVAERKLAGFFRQWVERTGAPALMVKAIVTSGEDATLVLAQTQDGDAYSLSVPVAITYEGKPEAEMTVLELTDKQQAFTLKGAASAARIDLDPQFDVFRRLDRAEIPPTLSQMFGADRVTIVVPDGDPQAKAWRSLAKAWTRGGQAQVVAASDLKELPKDRAVWVLGANNPWRRLVVPSIAKHGASVSETTIDYGLVELPRADHSFVYVAPHPANEELAVGWVGTTVDTAVPGLARKLPHYGKYSYLGFQGTAPDNVAKGRWPATGSPLSILLHPREGPKARGTLPARQPLARLAPVFDPKRLMGHVRWLADPAREGRGAGSKGLEASAEYIAKAMKAAGLEPAGDDGSFFQAFQEENGPEGKTIALRNVVGVIRGTNPKLKPSSVVLGAHYDHLGLGWPDHRAEAQGEIYNGADDNASGVSVMLELAALLGRTHKPQRTIVFVAFTGEEWGLKGSAHYVKAMETWPAKSAFAMVNLDTVGRLDGKKVQVLGSGTATEWRHIAMGIGFTTGVESNCIADDPGGSDQKSFVAVGVPAVQIFTGAHADYHRPTDDVEKIDADGLVKVATFVREAIVYLGDRERPLTSTLTKDGPPKKAPTKGAGRRVSFGTMPAFDYQGPGVKVAAVIEGSPAAKAGILKGDLLLALDGEDLKGLRGFSDALRQRAPGDVVRVRFKRGDEEKTVEATLVAR